MEEHCYELRVQLSTRGKRVVRRRSPDPVRYPYGTAGHKSGDNYEDFGNQKAQKRRDIWFKITIPQGRRYNRLWLLDSIKNECGFDFRAFQFHYVHNMAAFFVDSFSIARCLVQASMKIQGANYHKIIIKAAPVYTSQPQMDTRVIGPPDTGQYLDHRAQCIQSCLRKRYNPSLESLDLCDLANDPDLLSANISLSMKSPSAIETVLQIISESYPQLLSLNLSYNELSRLTGFVHLFHLTPRLQSLNLSYNELCSVQELDLIHNLDLRELWLEGNPLQEAVESDSAYFRLVSHHFPAIEKLDGLFFHENSFFEAEKPEPLPPTKGSFFPNDQVKTFLSELLQQYFTLYDSEDRRGLLPFYHENAFCSFSLPNVFYPRLRFIQIAEYRKENRNLLRVKRSEVRHQLLKYNRLQVVGFLCNLPKTEHDLPSITLDVSLHTPSMICFTVEGKFREVNASRGQTPFIPFRRTFVVVPAAENSAQILNDQMVILNSYVGPQETSSYVSSESTLAICQAPPTTADDIIRLFSKYTGMKPDWAGKCLQDNNWDLQQAKDIFHSLKIEGAIPQVAFEVEEPSGYMTGYERADAALSPSVYIKDS